MIYCTMNYSGECCMYALHKIKTMKFIRIFPREVLFIVPRKQKYVSESILFLQYKFRADTCNLDKSPILHRKSYARNAGKCEKYNQDFARQDLFIPLSAVILFPPKLSLIYTEEKKKLLCKESIAWKR